MWKTMKCADFEVKFRNIGYLLYYSDLIKGNKMCEKRWNVRILKVNYKILDKNWTIVLLYREVKCVENDEMCGFWSEISKYWIFTLL